MIEDDLYIILGVNRAASGEEIRRAYRKLARRYHPDVNPGDRSAEERFKKISEAYDILSDSRKRGVYDEHGYYSESVVEQQSETHWGFSFQGVNLADVSRSPIESIFSEFFDRRLHRREPERGQDLEHCVSLTFEESIRGVKTQINVLRRQHCTACGGSGRAPGLRESPCAGCGGSGQVSRVKGRLRFSSPCTECGGTGLFIPNCEQCSGEGRNPVYETLDVAIPPGVSTGSRVRIAGKGEAGRFGGPEGDLYVVTNVAPHPFFRRVGENIYCTIPITVTEAALGTKLEVPMIDGLAVLRIPPGTQSGQTFRLRGKGTPSLRNVEMRGDQYVEVRVVVPRVADERSKEILRELAKLNPENPRRGL